MAAPLIRTPRPLPPAAPLNRPWSEPCPASRASLHSKYTSPEKCVQLTNRPVVEPPSGRGGGETVSQFSPPFLFQPSPHSSLCLSPSSSCRVFANRENLAFVGCKGWPTMCLVPRMPACVLLLYSCRLLASKFFPIFTLSFAQCVS